ncbi:MAG TPA: HAMP domain-containing sensor histidine kinase [Solirubrobacteraceae bacterium]|nr:HAMP domain-containing sensor histidine kinase [Solirubrobacteraceae bacterium]
MAGIAVCGWVLAASAALTALIGRRSLARQMASVARACHELRGPITAARLGLELGTRPGALSPARLRALDLELGRAALAIDDLADVRARRRPPAAWEEVELRGLLKDSIEAWCSYASFRGTTLELRWGGGAVLLRGDRLRLAQAFGNLIANGIEHGRRVVEIRVAAVMPVGCAGAVRVEICDDGPGLPAPVAELARRGRRNRGAHGHGLVVAADVAIAHGGRLGSAPSERGARVVLELPVAAGARGRLDA